jgi:hypothetical protein
MSKYKGEIPGRFFCCEIPMCGLKDIKEKAEIHEKVEGE